MFFIVLGIIVGALALLLVMALIIGRFLPERYFSEVSHSSGRAPEEVWPLLHDPKSVCYGGKQARSVTLLSEEGEPVRWREDLGPSKFTAAILESSPHYRVLVEGEDSVVPMQMRREFHIEPEGSGALVTIKQNIVVTSGTWHVPIFRIMMSLGAATAGVKDYMRRLANALGEKPELS